MPIDTSIYNSLNQPPPNSLDTLSNVANVRNSLIQNQILQAELPKIQAQTQYAIKIANGQQKAAQYLAESKNPDGSPDTLTALQKITTDPDTAYPEIYTPHMHAAIALNDPTQSGYNPNGSVRNVSEQRRMQETAQASGTTTAPNVNSIPVGGGTGPTQQGQQSHAATQQTDQPQQQPAAPQLGNQRPSGIPGSLPSGMEQQIGERTGINQDYITQTRDAAGDASNQVVMLDKIKNLAKKTQTGPYAERINKFKAGLSELFGTDANSPATYEQLNKYMLANGLGQAAQNGANSDARTLAYVNSNPNTGILPEAVLPLAEYQQSLYRQKIGERNGLEKTLSKVDPNDPSQLNPAVENYRHAYSNNTDPQFYEYKNLENAEAKKTYIATHPGFAAQADKLKTLKYLGAID